jgi:hypothetical protein
MTAIVGPFDRLYPENPVSDNRRRLRRVEATCRVFSIEGSVIRWYPHYFTLVIKDDRGRVLESGQHIYFRGSINGQVCAYNSEIPCKEMCDQQNDALYPSLYPELHGKTFDHSEFHLPHG